MYGSGGTTIRAEEVRIPKHARDAVAMHEPVVVLNRERPVFRIVHPDDEAAAQPPATRRGRPMAEVVDMLATAPRPDPCREEEGLPVDPPVTLRQAVERHLAAEGFAPDGGLGDRWAVARVGPVPICVPNTALRRRAVPYHDANHVISGYGHDAVGEAAVGAWELGSGCGREPAAWVLNWSALVPGVVQAPRAVFRAFVRGRHTRNLYGTDLAQMMPLPVDEVRRRCGLDRGEVRATLADTCLFAATVALAPLVGLLPLAVSMVTSPVWIREGAHRRRRRPVAGLPAASGR
jgi:hypothetical protein